MADSEWRKVDGDEVLRKGAPVSFGPPTKEDGQDYFIGSVEGVRFEFGWTSEDGGSLNIRHLTSGDWRRGLDGEEQYHGLWTTDPKTLPREDVTHVPASLVKLSQPVVMIHTVQGFDSATLQEGTECVVDGFGRWKGHEVVSLRTGSRRLNEIRIRVPTRFIEQLVEPVGLAQERAIATLNKVMQEFAFSRTEDED